MSLLEQVLKAREEAEKALEVGEWKHYCPECQESEGKEG